MENASKALIIAGAILISIVLISVGIMIVNGGNSAVDSAISQMSQQDKDIYNNVFINYEGRKSGTQVKALLSQINTNNMANYEIEGKVITINFVNITFPTGVTAPTNPITYTAYGDNAEMDKMSTAITTLRSAINTGGIYTVSFDYDAKTGLITSTTITKV